MSGRVDAIESNLVRAERERDEARKAREQYGRMATEYRDALKAAEALAARYAAVLTDLRDDPLNAGRTRRIARDALAGAVREEPKCHCGSLEWTVRKHGRITHKHACPARTDSFCQTHPKGCPLATDVGEDG